MEESNIFLSLEELAKEINRSPHTIEKHFERTKENLAKKGIFIDRYGTGKSGKYVIRYGEE